MENKQLQTISENGMVTADQFTPKIDIKGREEFLKRMNEKPPETKKQSDYAKIPDQEGGFDTIPIAIIENMLDETYMGLWETYDPTTQVVANEITGTMILRVFDPSAKVWLRRTGFGAVTIRQKKDSKLTDIDAKIKTALQMDYAKLHSVLLKSACKSLGKKFGRDLNRKFEDFYEPVYTNELELSVILPDLKAQFDLCETTEDLLPIWEKYPQIHYSSEAKRLFGETREYLELKGLFEMKKSAMSPTETASAGRILKNKERNSYKKLHSLLSSK